MKRFILAAALAVLMPASAFAWSNSCGSNCPQSAVDTGQAQSQLQQQHQNAYGGSGGQGGAGGNGGNGYGGSATATASSGDQIVNTNNPLQAPAVSSFIAASGPCTGMSGGASVSVAGFGIGASFASLEADCQKRELLRIGFSSGIPKIQSEAADGWQQMYNQQFGTAKTVAGTGQTGAVPVAEASQTADAGAFIGPDSAPMVVKMMHAAK